MMLGIGMVALPAGMLASRFSQMMHENRNRFRCLVEEQLAEHGDIPEALVDQYRQNLFISPGEADAIVAECRREAAQPMRYCPNCGSRLPGRK
jgi:voltage-gated potassium channel